MGLEKARERLILLRQAESLRETVQDIARAVQQANQKLPAGAPQVPQPDNFIGRYTELRDVERALEGLPRE